MKLARIADNEPFYSVVVEREPNGSDDSRPSAELFDFSVIVPNTLRPDMPLHHREYLPALMRMQERAGVIARAQSRLQDAPDDEYRSFRRPLAGETLLPPVTPLAFRRFGAFAAHVSGLRQSYGLQTPAHDDMQKDDTGEEDGNLLFTFLDPACLAGSGAVVPAPRAGHSLDFGLEIAVVIGKTGQNLSVAEADSYIAGFTLCNGWCLRDVERREMWAHSGPGKSRDFAVGLGPALVTPDELADRLTSDPERGRVYDLTMTAAVNGREIGRGNARDMARTFAELIACASRDTVLHPGDVISSGTIAGGCLAEQARETHPWLVPGDSVRLTIDRLGVLENTIGEATGEAAA